MRHIVILILTILALASVDVNAQDTNDNCERTSSRKIKDIKKDFPFSETKKIKIVSFKTTDPETVDYELPKNGGRVETSKLFEIISLTPKDMGELLDILKNFGYNRSRGQGIIGSVMMCYLPRNAILFENDEGEVFSYIEICFECLRHKVQPEDMEVGDFCHEKYEMLQRFFLEKGIKYVGDR